MLNDGELLLNDGLRLNKRQTYRKTSLMIQSTTGMFALSSIVGNLSCCVTLSVSDCAILTTQGCMAIISRKVAIVVEVYIQLAH